VSVPAAGKVASPEWPPRTYRLLSATYQDKAYPEGVLRVNEAGSEVELRKWTGKDRRTGTVVARFNLEPNVEVQVDGPILRVSGLSITLESPGAAAEVADLLKRPAREREGVRLVSDVESSVSGFLEAREEALSLLSRIRADPRGALFEVRSMWTADDTEPLDAVYSKYSMLLAETFKKMTSSLAGGEAALGSGVTNRLYALAYTIGAVQNALFEGGSDLAQEVAALQELGIATTAQELRMAKPTERLMLRAHQVLVVLATASPSPGPPSSSG
jgi:hypothetical protein